MTKLYKVAYYIGDDVNPTTKFKTGFILNKNNSFYFFDPKITKQPPLERIYQVYTFKLSGLGQIIQVNNGQNYIFFFSVYFCLGGNFIMTKPSQTKKLHKILESKAIVSDIAPVSTVYWQPKETVKKLSHKRSKK